MIKEFVHKVASFNPDSIFHESKYDSHLEDVFDENTDLQDWLEERPFIIEMLLKIAYYPTMHFVVICFLVISAFFPRPRP